MRKQKEKVFYLHMALQQTEKKVIKNEKSFSPSPNLPLSFLIFTEEKSQLSRKISVMFFLQIPTGEFSFLLGSAASYSRPWR